MVFSARELILHHLKLRNHHRDILRSDELSNPYLGIFEPKFFGEFLPIWFWDVFLHLKPLLQTWLHRSSWSIPIALHWKLGEKNDAIICSTLFDYILKHKNLLDSDLFFESRKTQLVLTCPVVAFLLRTIFILSKVRMGLHILCIYYYYHL